MFKISKELRKQTKDANINAVGPVQRNEEKSPRRTDRTDTITEKKQVLFYRKVVHENMTLKKANRLFEQLKDGAFDLETIKMIYEAFQAVFESANVDNDLRKVIEESVFGLLKSGNCEAFSVIAGSTSTIEIRFAEIESGKLDKEVTLAMLSKLIEYSRLGGNGAVIRVGLIRLLKEKQLDEQALVSIMKGLSAFDKYNSTIAKNISYNLGEALVSRLNQEGPLQVQVKKGAILTLCKCLLHIFDYSIDVPKTVKSIKKILINEINVEAFDNKVLKTIISTCRNKYKNEESNLELKEILSEKLVTLLNTKNLDKELRDAALGL